MSLENIYTKNIKYKEVGNFRKTYSAMGKARQIKILTAWLLLGFGIVNAQTVSNTQANFSCPGQVTVTYDLNTSQPTDVTLYYSHNKRDWLIATTTTGNLTAQTTGTGKTIIWNNYADNVQFGKFYFKVEALQLSIYGCTVNSSLPVGKLTFMCYNLGAKPTMTIEQQMTYTTINEYDATVYGDLYQWGRNADGHEKRNSATTTTLSTTDVPGHGMFILPQENSGYYQWRNPVDLSLWGANKTANDPCPEGWRVPTYTEMSSIYGAASGNTWIWNNSGTPGYKISTDGGTSFSLFLPAAGSRFYYSNGFIFSGELTMYWCSSIGMAVNGYYFEGFNFISTSINYSLGNAVSAYGNPVRCIKEY
jgi:uncharacterized protein (TIGR02145 family)